MYVHLVDPAASECTPGVLRCLADLLDVVHGQVIVMGSAADAALARRCGLAPRALVPCPSWMPGSGVEALRRAIGREADLRSIRFVTWSRRADRMMTAAFEGRPHTLVLGAAPAATDDRDPGPWWRRGSPSRVLALGATVGRAWTERGVRCRSIAPAAAAPVDREVARRTARQRWQVDDDEYIIGVTVDPDHWSDARMGAELAHRLELTERPARLVVSPESVDRLLEVTRFQNAQLHDLLITDEINGAPGHAWAGLDLAVVTSRAPVHEGGSGVPGVPSPCTTAAVMAAGVPLIAETGRGADDLLTHERTGLLVPPSRIAGFMAAALRLYDDRPLATRLARAACEEASRHFSVERFAREVFEDSGVMEAEDKDVVVVVEKARRHVGT